MSKKVHIILTSTIATSLMLAGCGNTTDQTVITDGAGSQTKPGEKVTIVFWDENAGPQRTPFYEELIKQFEEANLTIDVEYVGMPNKSAKQKYDAAIAAEDLPDVGGVQTTWLADFTIRGALLPMDPYFDQWSEKDKLNKQAIQSNRDVVQDKKLYQIPNTTNLDNLWYRADWYKEAGVTPPVTWDDFFAGIEKMTDKSKNRYGFSIRGGKGGSFQLQRLMYAYSGITDYFDASGKSTINDPKHVEFMKKYLGLYKTYTPESDITNGYKEMVAGFDTGAVAMIQHNIGSYGEHSKSLKPEQYAALAFPKSLNGNYVVEGFNTNGYSIFKTTKHPDEAWKFISFLASAPSQSYWNKQIGQLPTHEDAINEDWFKNAQHIQEAVKVLNDPNTLYYYPSVYTPDYRSILDQVVDPGLQAVMSGKNTVEEFLNEWAAAMEKSKKQYEQHINKK
ncbi:ABC transporter substrate-binding protein [Brevibacillus dissolubilis]|uniref:ABC transporter substrate-binding protein n=1 Tax=Brevibacillus dissolubilis TaxID=1844116 RepID=UPI001116696A|nr:sugar ABC transporter substrate-binding protein [Brevibacillus dissolubilis]